MATYSQNHTIQNLSLNLGETWTIVGTLNKDNMPLPVDDNTIVNFRIANQKSLILKLTLTNDIVITDQTTAGYKIVVQPSQQKNTPALVPGLYRYELAATLSDGTVSIQAEGTLAINASLSGTYG